MSALEDCIEFARKQHLGRPQDGKLTADFATAELSAKDAAIAAAIQYAAITTYAEDDPDEDVKAAYYLLVSALKAAK